MPRTSARVTMGSLLALGLLALPTGVTGALLPAVEPSTAAAATPRPNIFIYHLDDLRDAFPGGVDPLRFMPKLRGWMADGRRYTQSFVADPSCCPSRSAMMTGRYPHNNGVLNQQDGPKFDYQRSMACHLQGAGYATYIAGKFLTTWPKTQVPPCFTGSTVMWGGYNDVQVKINGVARTASGYSTTYLGGRGRVYIDQALNAGKSFLLYETPQAPHWVNITRPDGTVERLAVPDSPYQSADVGTCSGVPETDRSDKPAYVRRMNHTTAQAQRMCASQLRAIMTADDEFDATMQLLANRGVLDNTLVIFSSDNGYMWGEHGRWEKFVPYEPSIRVPLWLRWPGHVTAGTDTTRVTSLVDVLPTILAAAGITPPASPALDGESLLAGSGRNSLYAEYYNDPKNADIPSWRMVRTRVGGNLVKYVHTYTSDGTVIAREYYNLTSDPAENTNLLGDANSGNDPPATTVTSLRTLLNTYATCSGSACVR